MRSYVEMRAPAESLEIKGIPCRRALSLSLSPSLSLPLKPLSFSDGSETDIKRCSAVLPSALSVFAQCALIIRRSSLEDKTFLGSIFRQATVESVT